MCDLVLNLLQTGWKIVWSSSAALFLFIKCLVFNVPPQPNITNRKIFSSALREHQDKTIAYESRLVIQSLQGSDDKDSVKIHWLERFFDGRYIRLYPLSWYGDHICMRIEIYGCIPGKMCSR